MRPEFFSGLIFTLLRGSLSFTSLSTVQIYDFHIFLNEPDNDTITDTFNLTELTNNEEYHQKIQLLKRKNTESLPQFSFQGTCS